MKFPLFSKSYKFQGKKWILPFLCLAGLFGCQERPDYLNAFRERIVLQLLIEPVPDPIERCMAAFQSQSDCLTLSTGLDFSPTAENLTLSYLIAFDGVPPVNLDLVSLCNSLLQTPFYSQFSRKAQGCYFGCQRDTWRKKLAANQCTVDGNGLLSPESERKRIRECIQRCGQINNTESL